MVSAVIVPVEKLMNLYKQLTDCPSSKESCLNANDLLSRVAHSVLMNGIYPRLDITYRIALASTNRELHKRIIRSQLMYACNHAPFKGTIDELKRQIRKFRLSQDARYLNLKGNLFINDNSLKIVVQLLPNLTRINLSDTKVRDCGLAHLVKLSALRHLDISQNCPTKKTLEILKNVPRLCWIILPDYYRRDFDYTQGKTWSGFNAVVIREGTIQDLARLRLWPLLFELDLDQTFRGGIEGLYHLRGCTNLRVFKYRGPFDAALPELACVLNAFVQLKELELGYLAPGEALVNAIGNLTQLHKLTANLRFHKPALNLSKLTNLREFSFNDTTGIESESIKKLSQLRVLRAKGEICPSIEILAAVGNLVSLEVLELTESYKCTALGHKSHAVDAIEEMLYKLTNLRELTLDLECVTFEMEFAIETLTQLESIKMNGTPWNWKAFMFGKNPFNLPNLHVFENTDHIFRTNKVFMKR